MPSNSRKETALYRKRLHFRTITNPRKLNARPRPIKDKIYCWMTMTSMDLIETLNSVFVKKAVYWGIIGLIIAGIYLQTEGIGKDSFFIDELYHVYAAKSLNENHTLSLPSGNSYERSSIYTALVGISFKIFGISEFSARLPSVVCGLLYLCFYYFIISNLFNRKVAILSTLMLVFSYMQIYYTKNCRMYSLLQLTYAGMVYCFYKIISHWMPEAGNLKFRFPNNFSLNDLSLIIIFILAAWISYNLQIISLLFLPSALIFIALIAIENVRKKIRSNRSMLIFLTFGIFAVLTVATYLLRGPLSDLYEHYFFVPPWSEDRADNFLFYMGVLKHETLLLWLLIPIGAAIAIHQFGRSAQCIICFLAIPFLILSPLPLKAARYIYHVYPFGLIFISVALVALIEKVSAKIKFSRFRKKGLLEGLWLLAITIFIGMNISNSYVESKLYLYDRPDWKKVAALTRGQVNAGDIVVADNPIAAKYYLGRVDYVINENLLQISRRHEDRDSDGLWRDYYTNALQIGSVEDLEKVNNGHKKVLVFLGHKGRGFKEIIRYIRQNYRPVSVNLGSVGIQVYQSK